MEHTTIQELFNLSISSPRSLFDLDLSLIDKNSRECGILLPCDNLDSAIRDIRDANRFAGVWDEEVLSDLTAYYIVYPALVALQRRDRFPHMYPFRYYAKCLLQGPDPPSRGRELKVLHAGCACEETALAGFEFVSDVFGDESIESYNVMDLCSIPVNRILRFVQLAPFNRSAKLSASVGQFSDLSEDSLFDIVITDRLLGSSPRDEYDVEHLRNFRRLLKPNGMIVTAVEAVNVVLKDEPHLPGTAFHEYFTEAYGETADKRDGKLGLSIEQWDDLCMRYHHTMARTYFAKDRRWRIKNAGDVVELLKKTGIENFTIWKVTPTDPPHFEDLSAKNADEMNQITGSLIVRAWKTDDESAK